MRADLPFKEFKIMKLSEGVYGFVWVDPIQNPVEGNSLFVINEADVLIVDACLFPSSTRLMIRELKKLTTKPVRYVVNTHFHDDHVNGNFVYRESWPDVEFISHRDTRTDIIEQVNNVREKDIKGLVESQVKYGGWLSSGRDDSGTPLDEARRKRVSGLIELFRQSVKEYRTVKDAQPDLTFNDSLLLYRGDRTIKILWLGLGNTRGDAVVLLPKERVAATGDLFVYPVPFGFGSYYKDWVTTLGKLDSLGADIFLPGHGPPQHDRIYLRQVRELLRTLVSRVDSSFAVGMTLEETQATVTLSDWRMKFAGQDAALNRSFDQNFLLPAVERAYHQAKGDVENK